MMARFLSDLSRTIQHCSLRFILSLCLVVGGAASFSQTAQASEPLRVLPQNSQQVQLSYATVAKKAAPAVVNIYAKRVVRERAGLGVFSDPFFRNFFENHAAPMRRRVQQSLGSGVLVTAEGHVLTNNHVIQGSAEIKVVLADRREYAAELVYAEPRTDLAVLRLQEVEEALPVLPLGDSDAMQVGDLVLAIGNPFGVGQTVTSGIISGLARTTVGVSDYQFFMQTDAAINPGNSGGALVNMAGQLIGVPTVIFSRGGGSNGVGFAIPSAMAKAVIRTAQADGVVQRPWLGLDGQAIDAEVAESLRLEKPFGVLVNALHPDSPLQATPVRPGAVITHVDGHEIVDPQALRFRLATLEVGTQATLTYVMNGREAQTRLRLQPAPESPPRQTTVLKAGNALQGLTISRLNPAVVEQYDLPIQTKAGLVIEAIDRRSPANRLGLRVGDVIVRVNDLATNTPQDLEKALQKRRLGLAIVYERRGQQIRIIVR